ncbi:MAG: hypothetical protein FJ161_04880 [Gammaproteobacteria bacterium]|nr:hypothetical protein [Gammaproteobacteria bacterium]
MNISLQNPYEYLYHLMNIQKSKSLLALVLTPLCHATCYLHSLEPGEFNWPTLTPIMFDEIALTAEKDIFDRTHVVIESSFRFSPFEHSNTNSQPQLTAQWSQCALVQMDYPKYGNFSMSMGFGYNLDRNIHSLDFGTHVWETVNPALILPLTIMFNQSNRHSTFKTVFSLDWEIGLDYYCRTNSILHRFQIETSKENSLDVLLFTKRKSFYYDAYQASSFFHIHQIGFMLEHSSY